MLGGEPREDGRTQGTVLNGQDPALAVHQAKRISTLMAPAPPPSLACPGLVMVGIGGRGTHVVICVSMKIRMKTRRAGMAEANIIHIGKVPLLPMG